MNYYIVIPSHNEEKFISLTDELETTLLYIKLEKLRFEENFTFDYNLQVGSGSSHQ